MNGHAEEVEEKELEKGEQVKGKEEPDTNASAGTEVPVKLCILLYLQQVFMTCVRAVPPWMIDTVCSKPLTNRLLLTI